MANLTSTLIMIAIFVVFMYFMMIKPQKKQQEQRMNMMNGLQAGDKVVTIGGLHGVIDSLDRDEKTVTLDCDGVYLVFNISSVARVLEKAKVQETAPQEETETETTED